MNKLVSWLEAGGSEISPKIGIQSLPGRGRAIVAKEHIDINELLICIRQKQLLNITCVPDRDERLSSHQQLALFIYKYKITPTETVWAPFLDQMPTMDDFSYVPLTWTTDQLLRLPLGTQKHVKRQSDTLNEDLRQVEQVLKAPIDYRLFLLAWLCVNTRCLYMKLPGVRKHSDDLTMAPYVDFLNHSDDDSSTVKVQVTPRGMEVYSTVSYESGDEIFLHYGAHDNSFLLCEYGFISDNNKWDTINVTEYILTELPMESQLELQEVGYFGDYTINSEGPSFRTEVALACWHYGGVTEPVTSIINGEYDQNKLQQLYRPLLDQILNMLNDELDLDQPLTPGYHEIIRALKNRSV